MKAGTRWRGGPRLRRQYTQLIARRIARTAVFSAVLPCTTSIDEIRKLGACGIVLSGGPKFGLRRRRAQVRSEMCWRLGIPVWAFAMGCSGSCTRSENSRESGAAGIRPRAVECR